VISASIRKYRNVVPSYFKEYMSDLEHNIAFWQEASEKDRHTILNLFKSKDYSWSLFLGHLVLEKLLKAHYVKHNNAQAIHTRPFAIVGSFRH